MNQQPHVLVIDDEPQILRAIRTILSAKHFKVTTASRGEEGLTLAASQSPDVIILDLSLPDIDGIEVCSRLREWTQTPIIVLSVRDSERDKVMALDRGADDYLTKPFGIEELLARIRVAMRHAVQAKGSPRADRDLRAAGDRPRRLRGPPQRRRGQTDGDRVQTAGAPGDECRASAHPPRDPGRRLGARSTPSMSSTCASTCASCARSSRTIRTIPTF